MANRHPLPSKPESKNNPSFFSFDSPDLRARTKVKQSIYSDDSDDDTPKRPPLRTLGNATVAGMGFGAPRQEDFSPFVKLGQPTGGLFGGKTGGTEGLLGSKATTDIGAGGLFKDAGKLGTTPSEPSGEAVKKSNVSTRQPSWLFPADKGPIVPAAAKSPLFGSTGTAINPAAGTSSLFGVGSAGTTTTSAAPTSSSFGAAETTTKPAAPPLALFGPPRGATSIFQAVAGQPVSKFSSAFGASSPLSSIPATAESSSLFSNANAPAAPASLFQDINPIFKPAIASGGATQTSNTLTPAASTSSSLFTTNTTVQAFAPVSLFQNISPAFKPTTTPEEATKASSSVTLSATTTSSLFTSTGTAAPNTSQNKTPQVSQYLGPQQHIRDEVLASLAASPAANAKSIAQLEDARLFAAHMKLLDASSSAQDVHEISGTPLFTKKVLDHSEKNFSQYGFLAGISNILDTNAVMNVSTTGPSRPADPRLFFNISAPSSAFICGSQGSGKSHTLSCLLENCLMKSDVSKLESPLAGLVLHYDSFTSDVKGTPCEAAHISSNPNVKVRVLVSPTNLQTMKRTYAHLSNVTVEPLRIKQTDLNTKRMLDLMCVNQDEHSMPLYLHTVSRILRHMRLVQQEKNTSFNYREFKRHLDNCDMTAQQRGPLNQRLDTLESFMPESQTSPGNLTTIAKSHSQHDGSDWSIKPGYLTIVDLSCPCVTAEAACSLFNMTLSIFLEQHTTVGRVIGLDEAHKYMNAGAEASTLTNTLLSSIRLQRHLGTRVFISTQEPTISPKLLDLCSITIVHRFTSPDWLRVLRSHLAALDNNETSAEHSKTRLTNIFAQIVKLRVGEALLFAPSAIVGVERKQQDNGPEGTEMKRLGTDCLKIKIRGRVTSDGGRSVFALGQSAAASTTGPLSNVQPATDTMSGGFSMFSKTPLLIPATRHNAPFVPFVEKEPKSTTNQHNEFQSITFQSSYQKYSFEELRLADYAAGVRFSK